MNKLMILFCIAAFSVTYGGQASAQWKQLNAGSPGMVQGVSVNKFGIFAGTEAGICKSTDNGATWKNVNSSITYCFAIEGSVIFAGTLDKGILVSSDGGETWAQRDSSFTYTINAFVVKDSIIFAGGEGMFSSTDDGATWVTIENGIGGTVTGLAIEGNKLLASTYGGVYQTTDDGNNWLNIMTTTQADKVINCIGAFDSTIFVESAEYTLWNTFQCRHG
ncbi:MAG: WD40/YVTN/BNR-like repeat-containing protein [Candidatus Kryptoniota bacterium]